MHSVGNSVYNAYHFFTIHWFNRRKGNILICWCHSGKYISIIQLWGISFFLWQLLLILSDHNQELIQNLINSYHMEIWGMKGDSNLILKVSVRGWKLWKRWILKKLYFSFFDLKIHIFIYIGLDYEFIVLSVLPSILLPQILTLLYRFLFYPQTLDPPFYVNLIFIYV